MTECLSEIQDGSQDDMLPTNISESNEPGIDIDYIDGSVQDCSNSNALAMELLQSCTKPSTCWPGMQVSDQCLTYVELKFLSIWSAITCPMMFQLDVQESSFNFIMVRYWQISSAFLRVTSLALAQSYDCTSASEATLKNLGKYITRIHL